MLTFYCDSEAGCEQILKIMREQAPTVTDPKWKIKISVTFPNKKLLRIFKAMLQEEPQFTDIKVDKPIKLDLHIAED